MRRRVTRFLPVFLLALAVQILAPVGACLARAVVASDPLSGAVLCQGAADDHAADRQAHHHLRDGSCAACAVATPGVPPAPQLHPTLVAPLAYRVTWRAFQPNARVAKIATSAQARAPPAIS